MKCAVLESLDAKLAAAGYPVRPPALATRKPTPAPALTFEAWAELSVRFAGAPPEDLTAALAAGEGRAAVGERAGPAPRGGPSGAARLSRSGRA